MDPPPPNSYIPTRREMLVNKVKDLYLCFFDIWTASAFFVFKPIPHTWHSYPDSDGKWDASRWALAWWRRRLILPQIKQENVLSWFLTICWETSSSRLPSAYSPDRGNHLISTIYLCFLDMCTAKAFFVFKTIPQTWHSYPVDEGKCVASRCVLALALVPQIFPQIEQEKVLSGFFKMYFTASSSRLPSAYIPNEKCRSFFSLKH